MTESSWKKRHLGRTLKNGWGILTNGEVQTEETAWTFGKQGDAAPYEGSTKSTWLPTSYWGWLGSSWDLQLDLGWVLSQTWGKPTDVDHMPLLSQVLWYLQRDPPDLNCPYFLFPSWFWHVFCFPNQTKIPVSWFPENIARGCLYSIPASTNLCTL